MPVLDEWLEDPVFGILDTIEEFINESDYDICFDRILSLDRLWEHLLHEESDVLYIKDGKDVAGFAIVSWDTDFTDTPFGYLIKFYIRAKYRKKGLDRELMSECENWFDKNRVSYRFATATAGIGENQLFVNLLNKSGYDPLGPTLCKRR